MDYAVTFGSPTRRKSQAPRGGLENSARTTPNIHHSETEVNVHVAVRIRPPQDGSVDISQCISFTNHENEVVIGKDRRFTFDAVFPPSASQESMYEQGVQGLVPACFQGYNATVLAYGQTGSGKTFTMGSGNLTDATVESAGIIPRVLNDVFLHKAELEETSDVEVLVRVSFLEIYNEEIRDLLRPASSEGIRGISVRENQRGEILLAGLSEEPVGTAIEAMKLLRHGGLSRTTGSTRMNDHSSRSHAIFTITIELRTPIDEGGKKSGFDFKRSKFHLVDLAGSERNKRTGASGLRFKESININSGLLALGNVISALTDERRRGIHIPYRASKLTRLLQDSLGGNARTLMIACASPSEIDFEESLNTLKYANRAKSIRNRPMINQSMEELPAGVVQDDTLSLEQDIHDGSEHKVHEDASRGVKESPIPQSHEIARLRAVIDDLTKRVEERDKEIARLSKEQTAKSTASTEGKSQCHQSSAILQITLEALEQCSSLASEWSDAVLQSHQRTVSDGIAGLFVPHGLLGDLRKQISAAAAPAIQMAREALHSEREVAEETPSSSFLNAVPGSGNGSPGTDDTVSGGKCGISGLVPGGERTTGSLPTQAGDVHSGELPSQKDAVIAQLQRDLEEARRDLQRDEIIFANKLAEIKSLRQTIAQGEVAKATASVGVNTSSLEDELVHATHDGPAGYASLSRVPMQKDIREHKEESNQRVQNDSAHARDTQHESTPAPDEPVLAHARAAHGSSPLEGLPPEQHAFPDDTDEFARRVYSLQNIEDGDVQDSAPVSGNQHQRLRTLSDTLETRDSAERSSVRCEDEGEDDDVVLGATMIADEENTGDMTIRISSPDPAGVHILAGAPSPQQATANLSDVSASAAHEHTASAHAPSFESPESSDEERRIRLEYARKLHSAERELQSLRQQKKKMDELQASRARTERERRSLEESLSTLRKQHDLLRRRLREQVSKHNDDTQKKQAEVAALRAQIEKTNARLTEVQNENDWHRDQLSKARNDLRSLSVQQHQGARRPQSAQASFNRRRSSVELKSEAIDKNIESLMKKRQAMEKLEKELERKADIIREKEDYLRQKGALEMRLLRSSMAREPKSSKVEGDSNSDSQSEMLREIEDKIDALEAREDFKNATIAKLEQLVQQSSKESALESIVALSQHDAKQLLPIYVERYFDTKVKAEQVSQQVEELTNTRNRLQEHVHMLQESLRSLKKDFDIEKAKAIAEREIRIARNITAAFSSNAASLDLRSSTAMQDFFSRKADQIEHLEKDCEYYKQTNRELKRKLRELVATSARDRTEVDRLRSSLSEESARASKLHEELHNIKSFMQRHHISEVRVSAKHVRPVSREDVHSSGK